MMHIANLIIFILWYCIIITGGFLATDSLTFSQVRKIRKLLKKGVDVPEICREFNIDPSKWRDISMKYSFFK